MRVLACVMAVMCSVATLESSRDARWLFVGRPITKVVRENSIVTRVVPSSCVVVEPSLPACRQMRELQIAPSPMERISTTESPVLLPEDETRDGRFWFDWGPEKSTVVPSQYQQEEMGSGATPFPPPPSPLAPAENPNGWTFNDLFKGMFSTVTQTAVHEETQWLEDKEHVVTFSVVGCLPTDLPFNLSLCGDKGVVTPTTASVDPRASIDVR